MSTNQPAPLNVIPGRESYHYSEDTSFVVGDDNTVLDIYTDLGKRVGTQGWFTVDGAGDLTIELSIDGVNYGDPITLKGSNNSPSGVGETLNLNGLGIHLIRVGYVADSAFRTLIY